ncbi:MAG TPA: cupin domain-containing protein [Candidatus Bathyarchaeia archaeon]
MYVKRVTSIKKKPLVDAHGAAALYQIFWQEDESGKVFRAKKPEPMKGFRHFARITLEPGETNNMHTHRDAEQVYFVLRGGGTVHVGDEKRTVKAGDAVFLPVGVPHGFFNTGDRRTVLLLVGTKA